MLPASGIVCTVHRQPVLRQERLMLAIRQDAENTLRVERVLLLGVSGQCSHNTHASPSIRRRAVARRRGRGTSRSNPRLLVLWSESAVPAEVNHPIEFHGPVGVAPLNFYYEKFSNTGLVTETGEAFDAKLALELGAASLVLGKLTADQLAEYRRLAEATVPYIKDGQFTDVDAFRRTNAAFHAFLIECTGNVALQGAYNRLSIQEFMAEALRPRLAASQKITQDHLDLVSSFRAT